MKVKIKKVKKKKKNLQIKLNNIDGAYLLKKIKK